MTPQKIIEAFDKTKFAKGGGSCFECCDYESMYSELKGFLVVALAQNTQDTIERAIKEGERIRSRYGKRKSMGWGERNLIFGVINEYQQKLKKQ